MIFSALSLRLGEKCLKLGIETFMQKEKIDEAIRHWLSGDMQLNDFREWFAGAYVEIRQDPSASGEAAQWCSQIVGPLAEFSRGHRSEDSLPEALEVLASIPHQSKW